MESSGPGCGQSGHLAGCACDVHLDGPVVPIRSRQGDWINRSYTAVLERAGIDLRKNPAGWAYMFDLVRAEEARVRCEAAGMYGLGEPTYTQGRKLLRAYLHDGNWTSELYEDDRRCAIDIAPEYTWPKVLAVWTTRNTKGIARINSWDRLDWENLEAAVADREPISRSLSRELGVSRSTIERMYEMHGAKPR